MKMSRGLGGFGQVVWGLFAGLTVGGLGKGGLPSTAQIIRQT